MTNSLHISEGANKIMNHKITDAYAIDCHAVTARGEVETISFGPFKRGQDEGYLSDLVRTLIRMDEAFPEDTFDPIQSDYGNVEGFIGWFDTDHEDADSLYDEYPDTECEFEDYAAVAEVSKKFGGTARKWPLEPWTNYDTPAKYQSYEVFYFDTDGEKRQSSVEFDGEG
jgi:hypothetical protein